MIATPQRPRKTPPHSTRSGAGLAAMFCSPWLQPSGDCGGFHRLDFFGGEVRHVRRIRPAWRAFPHAAGGGVPQPAKAGKAPITLPPVFSRPDGRAFQWATAQSAIGAGGCGFGFRGDAAELCGSLADGGCVTHNARRITHRWDIARTILARGSFSSANNR